MQSYLTKIYFKNRMTLKHNLRNWMIKSKVFGLCFFIIVLYKKYYLIFDKKVFKNFYNLNILNEEILDFSQIKFLFKTYRKNYNF